MANTTFKTTWADGEMMNRPDISEYRLGALELQRYVHMAASSTIPVTLTSAAIGWVDTGITLPGFILPKYPHTLLLTAKFICYVDAGGTGAVNLRMRALVNGSVVSYNAATNTLARKLVRFGALTGNAVRRRTTLTMYVHINPSILLSQAANTVNIEYYKSGNFSNVIIDEFNIDIGEW